ncbi:MAG: ABC transporter substrate-binding protein [Deltaproteobacteria bacterium]|jgi:ABC-type branched-subunit amino acid transport system substrate-binding protein|nr:ABC transporter substrate-binding protein [Deltaproteobacteria bacterium]
MRRSSRSATFPLAAAILGLVLFFGATSGLAQSAAGSGANDSELSVSAVSSPVEGTANGEPAAVQSTPAGDTLEIPIEPVEPPPPQPQWTGSDPDAVIVAAPRSGPWAVFGQDSEMGAALGLKSLGGDIRLRFIDEESPQLIREIISSPPPAAIIGHLYESTLAAAYPYYQAAKIPVILPFLEQISLDVLGPTFFRLRADAAFQGQKLALEVPRTGNRRPEQVIILQGPGEAEGALAEAFREALINPKAPAPTKQNPKPSTPRALNAKVVFTVPVNSFSDLAVLKELKTSPRDWVLIALPNRLALKAAPVLSETKLKRGTFIAPMWLAVREVGAVYLDVDINNLQVLVPVDLGTAKNPNKALIEFTRRYTQLYRRSPSWASVMAYDAARLACLATSGEQGPEDFLADRQQIRNGASGNYDLSGSGWPMSLLKVEENRLSFLP